LPYISLESLIDTLLASRPWEKCVSINKLSRDLKLTPTALGLLLSRLGTSVKVNGDCVKITNVLDLVITAVRQGVPEKTLVKYIDWRVFEEFAARALAEAGYETYRNISVRARGVSFELDVIGVKEPLVLVVECKHWQPKYTSPSRLREIVSQHLARLNKLTLMWRSLEGVKLRRGLKAVPVILVVREYSIPRVVEGAAIVPVSKLKGFLQEIDELVYGNILKAFTLE